MYRYNGIKRRLKIKAASLADAREAAREAFQKADKGRDPGMERKIVRSRVDTVEDLAKLYIEQHAKKRKRSWLKDEQILNREVIPVIGRKRVEDVTRQDIREVLNPIVERGALIRANHTLEIVRKMFNWSIETRDQPVVNPAALLKPPGEAAARKRWLRPSELKAFWDALDSEKIGEDGVAAFQLLILSAQREMEVVRMRWADIDFDEATWTVPAEHAKNAHEHVVPLPPLALSILNRLKSKAGKKAIHVFESTTKPGKHVRRVFVEKRIVKIRATAAIEHFTIHDLRRTETTYYGKLKVPQLIKKKLLNHTRRADVTDIYDRFEYLDEKRDALTKWEALLLETVTPKEDDKVVLISKARTKG
jgi:integrase